jgi:hypothetical protein
MIPAWTNGWGLNRVAGVDSQDPTGHGHSIGTSMVYCGELALEGKPKPSSIPSTQWCAGGKINPAPNFVMVYSNACYAPGAGETEHVAVSAESTALARVSNFSRPMLAMGGTYFATDLGSRDLVETILDNPDRGWGEIYTMTSGYVPGAVKTFTHPKFSTKQLWMQKSPGPGGSNSYFFAFAGDPTRTPAGGFGAPVPDLARPKMTSQNPFSFDTGVATNANVVVTFDKSVVGIDEWGMTLTPIDEPWNELNANVTWDEGSLTATLNPDSALDPGSWYVVTLAEWVEDVWGNPLADDDTVWSFRTTGGGPDPLSEQYNPQPRVNFAKGNYVGRRFDAWGNLLASKSYTLNGASSAPTSQQSPIPGQSGTWYYITAGVWAGYWIMDNAGTTLGTPPPTPPPPIATYNPPRVLYFAQGNYVGRKFDAWGNITASKSYTLSGNSSAPTTIYSQIVNQSGNWYFITAGVWAGYWIQESAGTVLGTPPPPPPTPIATYNPPQILYFDQGNYVGRQFDAWGNITASKSYTLNGNSSAPTTVYSTITNQSGNWYFITAGVWAGYWILESAGTSLGSP